MRCNKKTNNYCQQSNQSSGRLGACLGAAGTLMSRFLASVSAKLKAPLAFQRLCWFLSKRPARSSWTSASRRPKHEWRRMQNSERMMLRITSRPPSVRSSLAAFASPLRTLKRTSWVGTSPRHILPKTNPAAQTVLERPVGMPSIISGAVRTADPTSLSKRRHPTKSSPPFIEHMCLKPPTSARPSEMWMECSIMKAWTMEASSRAMAAWRMSTRMGKEVLSGKPRCVKS
mmetsp:Transcript_128969/g.252591  ORF Transcript_128969/g.252591 Transcript_128969/m.252591 type:complete len:230 (+) Transcript_128969:96-785(+)